MSPVMPYISCLQIDEGGLGMLSPGLCLVTDNCCSRPSPGVRINEAVDTGTNQGVYLAG